ncbi:dUTP diphosphatase [Bacillus velezensis]|uniref:dUTP diphosphatase n=1 Tax=Bacillus velezensis TaxID=492670 RepID=UPI001127C880|nr:dUTP diphosphatase [Bacillus velezensis]QDF49014.1 dimeric dUTPase [Bacillus velezensis]QDF52660.1 dimeric dUTPase [Bacillus velezensis]
MNLQKMFEMQKVLDDRIIKEKGLEGQDLLPNLILALQVELAECANEWRGFKHWSNNQQPNLTKKVNCVDCYGSGDKNVRLLATPRVTCPVCHGSGKVIDSYPLLEEYVDCLHFILSIGNRLDYNDSETINIILSKYLNIRGILNPKWLFSSLISTVAFTHQNYINLFINFFTLGKRLGFTIEQIEAAYMDKNAVNHQRQQEGY